MGKKKLNKSEELQKRLIALAVRLAESTDPSEPIKVNKEFSLDNLEGETIKGHLKVGNPRPYNPVQSSSDPEYFDVLLFREGRFMLSYSVGYAGGTRKHFYYFDGKNLRKSSTLFDGKDYR